MSSTTENLGLTLPDVTDFYDVGVTNTNMSLIDSAVGQIADTGAKEASVQSIITKIGTTTDTGGTATTGTIMGKLNALQNGIDNNAVEILGTYTSTRPSSSSTARDVQIVTVDGSGKLYAFSFQHMPSESDMPGDCIFSLIVDNQTISTFKADCTPNYTRRGVYAIGCSVKEGALVSGYYDLAYTTYYKPLIDSRSHSQSQAPSGTTDYDLYYTYISNPIGFTTNLTITCHVPAYSYGSYPATLGSMLRYTLD